ncbi:hypothetical protein [Streptomyces chiangmaiensis]|uniref:Uncharacterized protein n=1 Tax=Streptomyces chiangmaiensis TaxID=766497 RepID=A0ABU7FWS8_9ACTN|nr:hypothetical protein [Streptomyces chiangmaiensis]MED7828367.1 hypothetical protein [Streptomyces chiangmaiensis]
MLARFAYLAVSHAFAALRLLPMTDHEKDTEILALRHQLAVLHRQLGYQRPRFRAEDRTFLAALLSTLPAQHCAGSSSWSPRTPSCAGTATW